MSKEKLLKEIQAKTKLKRKKIESSGEVNSGLVNDILYIVSETIQNYNIGDKKWNS